MIILTDEPEFPRTKRIKANVRGMESDELLKLFTQHFHLMMAGPMTVVGGGYAMELTSEEIEDEFEFRKDDRIKRFLHGE